MNEIENTTKNSPQNIKLYSTTSIGTATFWGGPLAAGYMIGENFKALGEPSKGRNALIIGIISTIVLFVGIFSLPDNLVDKIPRLLIPIVYTGIVWAIVESTQGELLKQHKEKENAFYSGWRTIGIGLISMLILLIGLFGFAYFGIDQEIYDQYDKELAVFSANEEQTLKFYDHLKTDTRQSLLNELDKVVIPKWKENIQIIQKTNQLENLPTELKEQNDILLEYSNLRLELFDLFKKAIDENTDKYANEIERIDQEIEEELAKLNQ